MDRSAFSVSIPARLSVLALVACLHAPLAKAQTSGGQDTRLRLDQQLDRQRVDRESRAIEDAEALDGDTSSLTIDGQTYAVGDNVDEIGRALYVSVARKQWRDVRRFLAAYQKLARHDPMLVEYALGALAREKGDLAAAERHYRALLTIKADFVPGRLELARVLFDNHKDRAADRAFRAARDLLAHDGPQAQGVIGTVDAYLGALKRRRNWQGSLAIGPGYSSNLNQSSASYTCLLATDDGTCLVDRQVPPAIAAAGVNFEAMLAKDLPLGDHSGLRARAILFGDVYPGHHDYSQATAIMRLGYQYQTARDAISLSPSFEIGSLGSSELYRAPGINAEWTHTLPPRSLFRIEGNYRDFRYRDAAFTPQNGPLTDIAVTVWYSLTPTLTVFGGPDAVAKDTPSLVEAYRQWGARLGINKAFGNVASLFLMGSYRYRRHRAYSELFEAQRKDRQFNIIGIARLPVLKLGPLIPELVVQHTRVESNIDWLYSYKRTTASVRLGYAF
jgi:Ni/Co efflux regulator RcnB